MNITKIFLNEKNFVKEHTVKTAIVLHHTAGGHRPDNVIAGWNSDDRGRIATHYIIGGNSTSTIDRTYDGDIFQAIDEKYYAFALGIVGNGQRFDKCSIQIELCNYGQLRKSLNGKFYNWVNKEIPLEQVCDLGFEFRGFRYYHKYTDNQINSLRDLIKDISIRNEIDISNKFSFQYEPSLMPQPKIRGLYTHTNFIRSGKWDLSPQPNLVKMLESL